MASEYKSGYGSEVAGFQRAKLERNKYEEYLKTHDLIELKERVDGGEPNPIDPTYGGIGYTYYLPETIDLGRVKVSLERNEWKFEWEDNRG